jgi:MarR family 2-MHQ and catechol resistance regulon transcriptional repressor
MELLESLDDISASNLSMSMQLMLTILVKDSEKMKRSFPKPIHTWLIWMLASRAVGSYALDGIEVSGLGESDFRVLEVLLHKGPMPVSAIGPKVNLNPGSVSVAVDRLHTRGLVSRVEDSQDRRIRIVSLTSKGKDLIQPIFQSHVQVMDEVFSELKPTELETLETLLRRVGRRAQKLRCEKRENKTS